jgi:hypothetical protein
MRRGAQTGPRAPSVAPLPVDFGTIPAAESVAICGQCHMQSLAHDPEAGGAVNYSPTAAPFYRAYSSHLLSNYNHKMFYADGRFRATTFIGEAFQRSRCFLEGGAVAPRAVPSFASIRWIANEILHSLVRQCISYAVQQSGQNCSHSLD